MTSDSCWKCESEIGSNHRYCGSCGVPVAPFQTRQGEGFLRSESSSYLQAIIADDISYPSDPRIDSELEESLQDQLREDVRIGVMELGIVCGADDEILADSVDLSVYEEASDIDPDELLEASPAFVSLLAIVKTLTEVLPPEIFEKLGDFTPTKEDTSSAASDDNDLEEGHVRYQITVPRELEEKLDLEVFQFGWTATEGNRIEMTRL